MSLIQKLIRNRSSERDVRDYLDSHGYFGNSAKFDYLELHAIERPGWVQVFKFSVRVLDLQEKSCQLYGVVRDDERRGIRFFLAESEGEQSDVASEWSQGLITLCRQPITTIHYFLLALFAAVVFLAVFGAVVSNR